MITPQDIFQIIADGFFGGDIMTAGLVIYALVIIAVFVIMKSLIVGFVAMIPITLIFKGLGAISMELLIILIVVSVLGLAIASRKTAGDDL